jgi:biopolymer transport protein ExbD
VIDLQDENDGSTDVNMTPMIDCVFLLLIFFLVASTLKKIDKEIPLELPSAASAIEAPTQPKTLVIAIDANGRTFIGGNPVSNEALVARVREAAVDQPDLPIRIDADRNTAYQNVMRVIDELQFNGFKQVGLKTLDESNANQLRSQPAPK